MTLNQKLIELLKSAAESCDSHVNARKRDDSLPRELDEQIRSFSEILKEMLRQVNSNSSSPMNSGIGYAIADNWPFESWLGKQLAQAEAAYERDANEKQVRLDY